MKTALVAYCTNSVVTGDSVPFHSNTWSGFDEMGLDEFIEIANLVIIEVVQCQFNFKFVTHI